MLIRLAIWLDLTAQAVGDKSAEGLTIKS